MSKRISEDSYFKMYHALVILPSGNFETIYSLAGPMEDDDLILNDDDEEDD